MDCCSPNIADCWTLDCDWDPSFLPGLPSYSTHLTSNACIDTHDSFLSDGSFRTLSSLDDLGLNPESSDSFVTVAQDPPEEDRLPPISRWSTSTQTDASLLSDTTALPSFNLQDHPSFSLAGSPTSRTRLQRKLFRPFLERLRQRPARKLESKTESDIESEPNSPTMSSTSGPKRPRSKGTGALRSSKSLPDIADTNSYISRPLPPVPSIGVSQIFDQPRAVPQATALDLPQGLAGHRQKKRSEGSLFSFDEDSFCEYQLGPPDRLSYENRSCFRDVPALDCDFQMPLEDSISPSQFLPPRPLLERREYSYSAGDDETFHSDSIQASKGTYTRHTSTNLDWYKPFDDKPASPQSDTDRTSSDGDEWSWSPPASHPPPHSPPPVPQPVATEFQDLTTSFDSDATVVDDTMEVPLPQQEREVVVLQRRVAQLEAELATVKMSFAERLDALEKKGVRQDCIARLTKGRGAAPGPGPACAVPPTPYPRYGGGFGGLPLPVNTQQPSFLPSTRKQSIQSQRSNRSLRSISEGDQDDEDCVIEEDAPRKLSQKTAPDSLMHTIWPRPPSGVPSRPSSRRSSRPSTSGSTSKQSSTDSSVPPMPGAYPPKTPSNLSSASVSRTASVGALRLSD